MKLTPIKKILIGLAAVCVAVTMITTNNIASVMMIKATQNMKAQQGSVQSNQQNVVADQNANNGAVNNNGGTVADQTVSGGTADQSTGDSTATGDAAGANTATDNNAGASNGNTATGNNAGNAGNAGNTGSATASKKPATKAEIITYFNKSVNAVKKDAKTVNQKYVTNYLAGTTTISSGISGIYNMLGGDEWLDGMLQDNSQGEASYTGADITAKFPVEGQSWSSKLTEADVSSATCTESNGVYTIVIKTVGDEKSADVKVGEGHAPKAFNVILPGVVNDNIPGIAKGMVGTATMAYPESTVKVTVDAKTGNVLTAEYDLKWTINFDEMGIVLPFGTKALYQIAW